MQWTPSLLDLSVEVIGEKLRGVIKERGIGFSAWIRFEDLILCCLLEGVEACYRDEDLVRWSKGWEEGGRKFKLERRLNKSGRFLFCSIVAEGAKRSSLIFLEGRGLHRGWFVLVEKLCHLGVVPSTEVRKVVSLAKVRSTPRELTEDGTFADVVRKDLGVVGESVWLQLGESEVQFREEQLSRCLVWWFGKVSVPLPKLTSVEKLVTNLWSIARGRVGGEG